MSSNGTIEYIEDSDDNMVATQEVSAQEWKDQVANHIETVSKFCVEVSRMWSRGRGVEKKVNNFLVSTTIIMRELESIQDLDVCDRRAVSLAVMATKMSELSEEYHNLKNDIKPDSEEAASSSREGSQGVEEISSDDNDEATSLIQEGGRGVEEELKNDNEPDDNVKEDDNVKDISSDDSEDEQAPCCTFQHACDMGEDSLTE